MNVARWLSRTTLDVIGESKSTHMHDRSYPSSLVPQVHSVTASVP